MRGRPPRSWGPCSLYYAIRKATFPRRHTTEQRHQLTPAPPAVPLKERPRKKRNREQKTRSFTLFVRGQSVLFLRDVVSLQQEEGTVSPASGEGSAQETRRRAAPPPAQEGESPQETRAGPAPCARGVSPSRGRKYGWALSNMDVNWAVLKGELSTRGLKTESFFLRAFKCRA